MTSEIIDRFRIKIQEMRIALSAPEIEEARKRIPGCREEIERGLGVLNQLESDLSGVPLIDVVFLGPSRHGKSTLLNSLAGAELLPTSDTKPCSASIVKLKWAAEWSLRVRFVRKSQFRDDLKSAIRDAEEYLTRASSFGGQMEGPDDSKYFQNLVQRYVHFFRLNPEDAPESLLQQIKDAVIPKEIERLLGSKSAPASNSLRTMQGAIKKHLSTDDIYWTVVDSCEISGPFDNWHPNLVLVDLPGTNDTNPHRTSITNRMREHAKAVAIVTSDSNIGPDIESWLQNSSVLSAFIEATSSRRQRIFVVRTKFDSYLPTDPEGDLSDEEEDVYRLNAFERYKQAQADSYHEMFTGIVLPRLHATGSEESLQGKKAEILGQVKEIPIHFVSAKAHDSFCLAAENRITRAQQRLRDHFVGRKELTGIESLRSSLNEIANDYLERNYFEDIEVRFNQEASRLARYFQQERSTTAAQIAGAGESLRALSTNVQTTVIPWVNGEVMQRVEEFQKRANRGADEIRSRLDQAMKFSELRLRDKQETWQYFQWNSLRAAARKSGAHTTASGKYLDINEDICSVLVGDLILAWTWYRDELIQRQVNEMTDDFTVKLQNMLHFAAAQNADPRAREAIDAIIAQLDQLTYEQRTRLISVVEAKVRQLESIRAPAKRIIQECMQSTYEAISVEGGEGCQARMRLKLQDGFTKHIGLIKQRLTRLVDSHVKDLLRTCSSSVQDYGRSACEQMRITVQSAADVGKCQDQEELSKREDILRNAERVWNGHKFNTDREYWEAHDKLYPGGSSRSVEWRALAKAVKDRDGWKCVLCGIKTNLQADHIVPLSKKGSNHLDNLQTLCIACHEKKSGHSIPCW